MTDLDQWGAIQAILVRIQKMFLESHAPCFFNIKTLKPPLFSKSFRCHFKPLTSISCEFVIQTRDFFNQFSSIFDDCVSANFHFCATAEIKNNQIIISLRFGLLQVDWKKEDAFNFDQLSANFCKNGLWSGLQLLSRKSVQAEQTEKGISPRAFFCPTPTSSQQTDGVSSEALSSRTVS